MPCIDEETQEKLWLCKKHLGHRVRMYTSQNTLFSSPSIMPQDFRTSSRSADSYRDEFIVPDGDYSKFYVKDLTDPLGPFFALEHVYKLFCEVMDNVTAS